MQFCVLRLFFPGYDGAARVNFFANCWSRTSCRPTTSVLFSDEIVWCLFLEIVTQLSKPSLSFWLYDDCSINKMCDPDCRHDLRPTCIFNIVVNRNSLSKNQIKHAQLLKKCHQLEFLPCDATQNAVMPQYVVCLSVCLSITFIYRDHIGWIAYFENNFTAE